MQRRQSVVVALVAMLGLVLAWWATRGRAASATHATELAVEPSQAEAASRAPAAPSQVVVSDARLAQVLAQYRHDAVYPPGSRPLDEGARYKLKWNAAIVSDLPFARGLSYHFAADRHHVTFGEPIISWIEVWQTGNEARRVPLFVRSAWVMTTSGAAQGRSVSLRYHDDGLDGDAVAGDLRYSNRLVPSEHDELRASRQVQLYADVEAAGMARPMIRDFTYAARPVLEVVHVSDELAAGSLRVTVDCEVFEPGLYTFEANLVSADDSLPIGYVDQSLPLAAGRQKVALVFFGRVLHDVGASGPYLVRDLRGFERFLDGSQANLWWAYAPTHRTRAYDVNDFSAAEWDAPEKQDKIRRLEAARSAGR